MQQEREPASRVGLWTGDRGPQPVESRAVEHRRVYSVTVSCIYGFYTASICIGNYINNDHLSNIRASRGVPDCIPNN